MMIKKQLLSIVLIAFIFFEGWSQCINTALYPSMPITINSCSSGTITTCNWAQEYSELTFNTTGNFTFSSSISTDFLTLTTAANVVVAFGTQPLSANIPSTGGYRLHVSNNSSCGTDNICRVTSYDCSVPCSGMPTAGNTYVTSGSNVICTPSVVSFALSGATNATGLTYQWQMSTNGGSTWPNIVGATNATLSQSVSLTSEFRCIVSCGSYSVTSASMIVWLGASVNGGTTLEDNSNVCAGSYVNFSLSGASNWAGMTYQWESSNTGTGGWSSISGQTGSTMLKQVNASKYDHCILTCGTYTAASSSILVTVAGVPTGGTTVANNSTPCGGGGVMYSLSGASTTYGLMYQWQSSSNGTTWTNLTGEILSTTTQNVFTSTYFRCLLSCGTSTSTSSALLTTVASGGVSYATVPYYQTFDNTWQNGCDVRDVPDNLYWKNTPNTGDNSWRRQDDGSSANWSGGSTIVPYSGIGCADFHSTWAPNNTNGTLDFYVDMNQNGKYALSFYYLNVTGSDHLDVLLSTDAGASYSVKGAYTTQASWTKKTIYFNSPNSATCIIRLRGTAATGNDDIGIDSLSLKLICLNPTVAVVATSTVLCAGQSLTITASGATNYTWSPTGLQTASIVVTPTTNTHYIATGSNDGLCFPTAAVSVSVVACNGIEEFYGSIISVYPNPTSDVVTILLPMPSSVTYIEITDALGKITLKEELKQERNTINIEELANGLYFYKVLQGTTNIGVGKIQKQ
jgi:hypothetical protein